VIDQQGNVVEFFWFLEDEEQLTDTLDRLLQAG
jgi:hypothetical protein